MLLLLAGLAAIAGGDEIVARVDGVAISRTALVRRAESRPPQSAPPRAEDVLEGLVAEALLANEGRRLGLAGSAEVARHMERETRRAAARAFAADLVAGAKPDEAELREAFHSTADVVAFESLGFAARADAEAALRRIAGGSALAAEARTAVVARVYAKADEAPPSMRGELPRDLADALFAAAPGTMVGPFETGAGWIVARALKRDVGTEAAFAARREPLARFVKEQLATQARRHLVEKLRTGAAITVDETFLAGVSGIEATPEQLAHAVATVNGRRIEYRDVHAAFRALGGGGGHGGSAVKSRLVQQAVDEMLLEDVALERGYGRSPGVTERRGEIERAALALGCAERIRASATPPSEDEIAAFYRRNAARYGRPFQEVLPAAAAGAAAEKREDAVVRRIRDLRAKASVNVDRQALGRALSRG